MNKNVEGGPLEIEKPESFATRRLRKYLLNLVRKYSSPMPETIVSNLVSANESCGFEQWKIRNFLEKWISKSAGLNGADLNAPLEKLNSDFFITRWILDSTFKIKILNPYYKNYPPTLLTALAWVFGDKVYDFIHLCPQANTPKNLGLLLCECKTQFQVDYLIKEGADPLVVENGVLLATKEATSPLFCKLVKNGQIKTEDCVKHMALLVEDATSESFKALLENGLDPNLIVGESGQQQSMIQKICQMEKCYAFQTFIVGSNFGCLLEKIKIKKQFKQSISKINLLMDKGVDVSQTTVDLPNLAFNIFKERLKQLENAELVVRSEENGITSLVEQLKIKTEQLCLQKNLNKACDGSLIKKLRL